MLTYASCGRDWETRNVNSRHRAATSPAGHGEARIDGLKSALAILALLSIVALLLTQRIPTRQPGAVPL
jgi:hypothetical protein